MYNLLESNCKSCKGYRFMYIQFHVLKFGIQLNYMELICMGTFVLVI